MTKKPIPTMASDEDQPTPSLADQVLGTAESASAERLVARTFSTETRENVRRTQCAAESPELLAQLRTKAVTETMAAAPPPIDPEQWPTDRWGPQRVTELQQQVEAARVRREVAEAANTAAQAALANCRPAWSLVKRCGVGLAFSGLTMAATWTLSKLLAPTLDAFIVHPYFEMFGGDDGESRRQAQELAVGLATLLFWTQAGTVLMTWGRYAMALKVVFFLTDIAFSVAFGLLRWMDAGEGSALVSAFSVSLFELTLLLAFAVVVLALSTRLQSDGTDGEAYALCLAKAAQAEKGLAATTEQAQQAEARLLVQARALEEREAKVRRLPALCALAEATVEAECSIVVAEMVAEQAVNRAEDAFEEMVEADLTKEFDELKASRGRK